MSSPEKKFTVFAVRDLGSRSFMEKRQLDESMLTKFPDWVGPELPQYENSRFSYTHGKEDRLNYSYAQDYGMSPENNCNQHLTFEKEQDAQEYLNFAKNDPECIEIQRCIDEMDDEAERYGNLIDLLVIDQ